MNRGHKIGMEAVPWGIAPAARVDVAALQRRI